MNLHKFSPEFICCLGKQGSGEKGVELMKVKKDSDKFEVCIDILATPV